MKIKLMELFISLGYKLGVNVLPLLRKVAVLPVIYCRNDWSFNSLWTNLPQDDRLAYFVDHHIETGEVYVHLASYAEAADTCMCDGADGIIWGYWSQQEHDSCIRKEAFEDGFAAGVKSVTPSTVNSRY